MIPLVLVLLACIFLALAMFRVPEHPRFWFFPAGMFCLALVQLVALLQAHHY